MHPRPALALPAVAAVLVLAACAASASGEPDAGGASPTSGGHPVTLDNCGFETTVEAPPERVVTIKSSTTEMLLALGLGDRIVGSAFLDGPVPDERETVPAVDEPFADEVPGSEATLALEPDLVYAGWESNLTAETAGDRATLAALGVATYVSPAACKADGYMPDPLTFETVFDEIAEVGSLFGAEDAAAALVEEQRAALDAATPDDRGLTALWWSSGDDTPYVGAGIGAPQMIMEAAGLTNVAADVHDTWTSLGWESIVEADPDVIVLVDAVWNPADAKIEALESNPATREMTAVREERYVVVPFPATEAGVRNVDAVASVVEQLADLNP
ncbi:putative F420-0 ABC transporter substrate-binding protein [Promicromonospora thailandica]|uniref:Iron complex transport system substrate-binding protein n=1 Tax=Promicromonospora thailandica TaxID=765201 RepID=A0A9X2JUA0_9MICO|nr:putative F420-0 ABC transporter substrate-binding protein [Promicromonospora thailandica]MCP2263791.1 iron complex transport system substrate-binding protein [Promicromonospora thailandica]BFF17921.1 ABC transporter substrate-binding protein [Promicromonospora thailandica]